VNVEWSTVNLKKYLTDVTDLHGTYSVNMCVIRENKKT